MLSNSHQITVSTAIILRASLWCNFSFLNSMHSKAIISRHSKTRHSSQNLVCLTHTAHYIQETWNKDIHSRQIRYFWYCYSLHFWRLTLSWTNNRRVIIFSDNLAAILSLNKIFSKYLEHIWKDEARNHWLKFRYLQHSKHLTNELPQTAFKWLPTQDESVPCS